MKPRCLILFMPVILFFLAGMGCGLEDEPITSPHAIAIVQPIDESGPSFLFASNRFLDRVYRINLESLDIKSVKTGTKPRNITASPDGSMVAVANEESMSITLIRTMNLAKKSIYTGAHPTDIRFSPDGKWIAVANYDEETVSLVSTEDYGLIDVWVGGGPVSVAFDDTSSRVAVALYREYSIKVINMDTYDVQSEWFWYDYDWPYDNEHPQVLVFGKEGTFAQNKIFTGHQDSPDYYYYDDYYDAGDHNGILSIMTLPEDWQTNPQSIPTLDHLRTGANPRGLFWDRKGERLVSINHYYYDNEKDSISVFTIDREGEVDEERRYVVGGNPVSAAISPVEDDDLVAVACKVSGRVYLIDLNNKTKRFVNVPDKPYAIAFTPSGKKIVVVHESPLMPVSVVDVDSGSYTLVYESIAMDRWIE